MQSSAEHGTRGLPAGASTVSTSCTATSLKRATHPSGKARHQAQRYPLRGIAYCNQAFGLQRDASVLTALRPHQLVQCRQ
eukprot:4956266-Pyramimonas_sp.AAC.2